MWYFSGFNGFSQFGQAHANKVDKLTNFCFESLNKDCLITSAWSYNTFAVENMLVISGLADSNRRATENIKLPDKIVDVCSTDDYCLIMLYSGKLFKLWKYNLVLQEVKISSFESKIFEKVKTVDEYKEANITEALFVEKIACGSNFAIAITSDNCVFVIPKKIFQFSASEKIIALQCGFEHAIALNSNGDVYTWGNGLRGQLGIDDLKIQENPKIVEALRDIKIISIAAGGWHSAAVSSFGDVYTWGLNINGQLGIRVFKTNGSKNPTLYPLPRLVDLPQCLRCRKTKHECITVTVHCGARHTIAKTSCGSILGTGWNKYGQLALADSRSIVDKFEKICDSPKNRIKVMCGPWSTIFKFY